MKTANLTLLFDNGMNGDQHQSIARDDEGNLYMTNNAETQARLTGREWLGWSEEAIDDATDACVEEYGHKIGLNVASQCGGYEQMGTAEQEIVDEWNQQFGR